MAKFVHVNNQGYDLFDLFAGTARLSRCAADCGWKTVAMDRSCLLCLHPAEQYFKTAWNLHACSNFPCSVLAD